MNLYVAICVLALTASTKADGGLGLGSLGGLVYAPGHSSVDYYAYPRYAFEYSVKDPHTGDNKAQWEKRDGDVVKGAYSLVEPDGSLRVVEYHADDKTGFNAVVKRLGPNLHPATVHAAPIYKAPIPVLGGHGSVLSPISVGPVANLGHLASAPLISGPIHGGPIYSPALSSQNLIKEPVIVKHLPAPILSEPILHEPIHHVPILKSTILSEPIYRNDPIVTSPLLFEPNYKGHILPGPIYKNGPLLPGPIYKNGPILPGPIYKNGPISYGPLPISGPIYKAGPIYSESLGPLPDYKAPLPLYNEHVPLHKEPLPALPLLKGPVDLGLYGKGPISTLDWEGLGRGHLEQGYGLGKGIGPLSPYLGGYGLAKGNIGPVLPYAGLESGHGLLKGNIGPILPYEGLEKGRQLPSWNGPIEYPLYPQDGYKH
ncbi:microtubule-associated protein 6-like [Cydia strobilella]|uniref:microtubule-associated protein 6-like n=1 Tax=Cydia strobilella TaxID=1100964 RepID=UPI003006DA0E